MFSLPIYDIIYSVLQGYGLCPINYETCDKFITINKNLMGVLIWQTIVFVELIVIHANSKQNKTARGVKRLKAMCFGANVIYINVIHKKIKNIAENALNFLVTH